MSINSSKVRSIVKFGFGCLMVDGLIELATSYEAKSVYEFTRLSVIRNRAKEEGVAVKPMTRAELLDRARCNVGGPDIAKYNLRKKGVHTVVMTATTSAKNADGVYIETMQEVSTFDCLASVKAFFEAEASNKADGRTICDQKSENDLFIIFDGEKPDAWTDAIHYNYKVI